MFEENVFGLLQDERTSDRKHLLKAKFEDDERNLSPNSLLRLNYAQFKVQTKKRLKTVNAQRLNNFY